MWDRLDKQHNQRAAGEAWNGTIAACHSRKHADEMAMEARRRYGKALVRLYTGESCDLMKREHFSDAAKAWGDALIVIYTGTVSVGVSANTPHIDSVFAFFMEGNASAAGSAQMLFRARQVRRIEISFSGGVTFGLPRTRDALLEWATLANNRRNIPDEFRHDRSPLISAPTASDPSALNNAVQNFEGRLWVNAQLEQTRSQSDFIGRLRSILERAGLTVTLADKAEAVPAAASDATPTSGEEPELARVVLKRLDALAGGHEVQRKAAARALGELDPPRASELLLGVMRLSVERWEPAMRLLPSFMRLMGRSNWWAPGPLARLHARIGISEEPPEPRPAGGRHRAAVGVLGDR